MKIYMQDLQDAQMKVGNLAEKEAVSPTPNTVPSVNQVAAPGEDITTRVLIGIATAGISELCRLFY